MNVSKMIQLMMNLLYGLGLTYLKTIDYISSDGFVICIVLLVINSTIIIKEK
jgi:hypothetical protein